MSTATLGKRVFVQRPDRSDGAIVVLPGVDPDAPLVPRLARQALAVAGYMQGYAWELDREFGYRVYARSVRRVTPGLLY